jgi:hypothetical protein
MRITSSKVAALAKQFRVDPELITAIADTLAEQEHSRMSRRTRAGVARARKLGRVSGPVQMPLDMAEVKARQAKGQSLRTIAKAMGCSASLLVKRAKGGRQGRPQFFWSPPGGPATRRGERRYLTEENGAEENRSLPVGTPCHFLRVRLAKCLAQAHRSSRKPKGSSQAQEFAQG